jgi:hypothetical protein
MAFDLRLVGQDKDRKVFVRAFHGKRGAGTSQGGTEPL